MVKAKKDNDLITKFKEIEDKILSELKQTELNIDYSADRKTIVSSLKSYIKRVKNIEKILDEYEALSRKLETAMVKGDKQTEVTTAVVDLREDSEELKTEIQIINGQTSVKRVKKKTTSASVKEF